MSSAAASAARQAFQRLPKTVAPVHYNLRLKPDLAKFTFQGWMNVDLDVKEETKQLVCNASDLQIDSIRIKDLSAEPVPADCIRLCSEAETLTVDLAEPLPVGPTRLFCTFRGTLNDQLKGFYRSKYPVPCNESSSTTDTTGTANPEDRYGAVTQFEATDARRCFPCWDEPALKATFSVSVIAPNDRTVVGNLGEIEKCENEELEQVSSSAVDLSTDRLVCFAKSPIMSTYLVALVLGEFDYCSGQTDKGTAVRVYTPKGKQEQGQFALQASIKALEFYTEYFDVAYPLPKYDCIAVADFEAGAMENWGLVTYRETCILNDPKTTSSANKQWIAVVVTHEMAHQWFGNLVTMEWWTHLWLNEGFASFMENYCTDALFPEFDMFTQFVAGTLIPALELDALENSHPIEVAVGHPDEVNEIFDNISYNKGASVIRMLHNYIGNDAFRKGMNLYLNRYSYKNTFTENLWECLEEASQKPVGAVMTTWTSQMGFPVIVVESIRQDGSNTVISVKQEKFVPNEAARNKEATDKFKWKVPINLITSKGKQQTVLLDSDSMDIVVENNSAADSWVKLNHDYVGYYRVQYPSDYLSRFLPDIESKKLCQTDRLGLLNDLMASIESGRTSTDVILKMLPSFKAEDSYVVWSCICDFLRKLNRLLADQDCHGEFRTFALDQLADVVGRIGWEAKEGEHHTTSLLREMVLAQAGVFGHEATVAEAQRRFKEHLDKTKEIPADLRSVVYRVVAAHGGQEAFEQLRTLHKEEGQHEEKERLARAMGATKDKSVLEKVLAFAISDQVRAQDTPFTLSSCGANSRGRELTWQFFQAKYDLLQERYPSGSLYIRCLSAATSHFVTEDKAKDIEAFFADKKCPAERTLKQSLEAIRLNASWLDRDLDKIVAFLKE